MLYKIIEDPDFHGGLIMNINETKYYKGNFEVNVLKETLIPISYGLMMPRHHFLISQSNQVITGLYEGGIIQRWVWLTENNIKRVVKSEPKVLTMDQLNVGFQIWIVCLIISSIIFIVEHLVHCCKSCLVFLFALVKK